MADGRLAYRTIDKETHAWRLVVRQVKTGKELWFTADTEVLGIGKRWLVGVDDTNGDDATEVRYFNA